MLNVYSNKYMPGYISVGLRLIMRKLGKLIGLRNEPSTLLEKLSRKRMSLRPELVVKRINAALSYVVIACVGIVEPHTVATTVPVNISQI